MIGTSLPEYVFIVACIAILRAIAPLSILYTIFWIVFPIDWTQRHRLPPGLEIYVILESFFFFLVYLPLRARSQFSAVHPENTTREAREALFKRCADNIPDPDSFLKQWFLNADLTEIKKENVKEWIRWGFFSQKEAGLLYEDEADEYVEGLAQKMGRTIKEGRGNAKSFRLTFDDVNMQHRCLAWYFIIFFVDMLTAVALMYNGYSQHRLPTSKALSVFPPRPLSLARQVSPSKQMTYWHRRHTSQTRLPILFIHGIGIGLFTYISFLAELAKNDPQDSTDEGQVGILAVEIMPISARLTTHSASMTHLVAEIHKVLAHHNYTEFVLVANSYGTAITTNILHSSLFRHASSSAAEQSIDEQLGQLFRPRIASLVLIDPIPFLLHLPSVAYNFTKRSPRRANEHQLFYFASQDMGVAHTLARHLFWTENILWRDEIIDFGGPVCVCLAGQDLIVDAREVFKYLTGGVDPVEVENEGVEDAVKVWEGIREEEKLKVVWFEKLDHAQVFDYAAPRRVAEKVIWDFCKAGGRESLE